MRRGRHTSGKRRSPSYSAVIAWRAAAHAVGVAVVAAGVALPSAVDAQGALRVRSAPWVGTPLDDYLRVLQLTGAAQLTSRLLRPNDVDLTPVVISDSGLDWRHPWRARFDTSDLTPLTGRAGWEYYHPIVRTVRNSAVPYGSNDGAMWAGRGISASLEIGGAVKYGPVTVRLAPSLVYSENRGFPLAPLYDPAPTASTYADPFLSQRIDRPQRFGDSPFWRLDPGQTAVQLDIRGVRLGASTEHMWWGPGAENALLMTNNAPGFPHVTLGTSRPVDVRIGKLELLYTVGSLQQSQYWRTAADATPTNRWVNAVALTFEPRGAPGLYIGAGRLFYAYVPRGGITLGELATVFQPVAKEELSAPGNPSGDDVRDQLFSLFARWVFPAVGFEVYGEFGRNDHSWDSADLVQEPDHSRAYVAGFAKAFGAADRLFVLSGEIASLGSTLTVRVRDVPKWYAHYLITQGFTQRGQVIGAGIGPGSDQQSLRADWFRRWGRAGVFVTRLRDNSDSFYEVYDDPEQELGNFARHDVFFGVGVRGTVFAGPVDLMFSVLRQREFARYTVFGNSVMNTHIELRGQFRWP